MTFLLDAGVWLAADHAGDARHGAAVEVLGTGPCGALDLTLYEVTNVAIRQWRDVAAARRMATMVELAADDLLVRADARLLRAAARLADDRGLSAYDAAHVAAARELGWTLVSTDLRDLVAPGFAVTPEQALAA